MIRDVTITFVQRGRMKLARPIGTMTRPTARPVVPVTNAPITAESTAGQSIRAVGNMRAHLLRPADAARRGRMTT